jgi:hypothetical protein
MVNFQLGVTVSPQSSPKQMNSVLEVSQCIALSGRAVPSGNVPPTTQVDVSVRALRDHVLEVGIRDEDRHAVCIEADDPRRAGSVEEREALPAVHRLRRVGIAVHKQRFRSLCHRQFLALDFARRQEGGACRGAAVKSSGS